MNSVYITDNFWRQTFTSPNRDGTIHDEVISNNTSNIFCLIVDHLHTFFELYLMNLLSICTIKRPRSFSMSLDLHLQKALVQLKNWCTVRYMSDVWLPPPLIKDVHSHPHQYYNIYALHGSIIFMYRLLIYPHELCLHSIFYYCCHCACGY